MRTTMKGNITMPKEKKPYYKKFNALELWMWQNKKHLGSLLKLTSHAIYGSRNTKWRYDIKTEEFTFNTFVQIEKHKWSKEPIQRKISAKKLLRGCANEYSPIWISFQKALDEYNKSKEAA